MPESGLRGIGKGFADRLLCLFHIVGEQVAPEWLGLALSHHGDVDPVDLGVGVGNETLLVHLDEGGDHGLVFTFVG